MNLGSRPAGAERFVCRPHPQQTSRQNWWILEPAEHAGGATRLEFECRRPSGQVRILSIAVEPELRRRRVGTELVAELVRRSGQQVFVSTAPTDAIARAFWDAIGRQLGVSITTSTGGAYNSPPAGSTAPASRSQGGPTVGACAAQDSGSRRRRDAPLHGATRVTEEERRVPGTLCEIVVGRTLLGVAYAHLLLGSEVVSTSRGLTRAAAVRRAQGVAAARGVIGAVRVAS